MGVKAHRLLISYYVIGKRAQFLVAQSPLSRCTASTCTIIRKQESSKDEPHVAQSSAVGSGKESPKELLTCVMVSGQAWFLREEPHLERGSDTVHPILKKGKSQNKSMLLCAEGPNQPLGTRISRPGGGNPSFLFCCYPSLPKSTKCVCWLGLCYSVCCLGCIQVYLVCLLSSN